VRGNGNGRDRQDQGQGQGRDGDGADLGASEWPELGGAPDVDTTLRIAHQVQRDFDGISAVRAGDEALIARAVDRVLVGRPPVVRPRADRRVAAVLGLGVALFASGAAAWWAVRSTVRSSADGPGDEPLPAARAPRSRPGGGSRGTAPGVALPPPAASAPVAAPELAPPPVPVALPDPIPSPSPALAPVPAAPRPPSRPGSMPLPLPLPAPVAGSPRVPPPAAAGLTPAAAPAAELFRRASDARRAGDVSVARALYREVQDRFPGSAEARLVRVSLGKLLLDAGDARGAEAEFALYLAGGGPLVQEALVGQAECLRRLARPEDERRVWQRLVDEFPAGVYEPQARRRLAELGVPEPAPVPVPVQ
jgi:hypothetical protein